MKSNELAMGKQKYDRRRAIDCKLLKKSSTHKGYCKYIVTICELDGTCHKELAYGVDMQDALSRLINKERTVKVERKISNGWFALLWLVAMGWPALLAESYNSPKYLLYSFGGIFILGVAATWWYHYVNKEE